MSAQAVETWRAVPFAIGYEVSDQGRLRSLWEFGGADPTPRIGTTWRVRKGSRHRFGYTQFYIRTAAGRERWWIHRLIAWVFHGPAPFKGAEVRHLNGDPTNNAADNLAWGTHAENQADMKRHGSAKKGENCPTTKLTNNQVRELVRRWRDGEVQQRLAEEYMVSPNTVSRIVRGLKWSSVTGIQPAIRSTTDGGDSPPAAT
jgi:hypothetical protein